MFSSSLARWSTSPAPRRIHSAGSAWRRHESEGRAYRYHPTVAPEKAGRSALARIREAVYQGSAELMFAQLVSDRKLKREELERMRCLLADRLKEES